MRLRKWPLQRHLLVVDDIELRDERRELGGAGQRGARVRLRPERVARGADVGELLLLLLVLLQVAARRHAAPADRGRRCGSHDQSTLDTSCDAQSDGNYTARF